jgi:TrmH family RNA methyltransferase
MPDIITSASNPRIRRLVELQKKAKLRRETGLFVIEGVRLCADTPAKYIKEVYVTENRMHSASEKENRILKEHPVTIVSEEVMAKAAQTTTPQGILCVAKMPVYSREKMLKSAAADPALDSAVDPAAVPAHDFAADPAAVPAHDSIVDSAAVPALDSAVHPAAVPVFDSGTAPASGHGNHPLLLVLEDIQDPGNLGTIFRTAEAAGATGIVMSRGTVDIFHPKVVRATMSAVFRMPFYISNDLCAEISAFRERGIRSYAAHLGGKRAYDELPLSKGCAFLIGNEGNGLSEELTAQADEKIIIPMAGGAESLNAAMAAGILLFEAARQRRTLQQQETGAGCQASGSRRQKSEG